MIGAIALIALMASGVGETVATPAASTLPYAEQFTKAVFQLCPDALRTSGASFEDSAALAELGLHYTAQSETIRKIFDYREASSDLLEINYIPKSDLTLRTFCSISFHQSTPQAKDMFIIEWKKLATRVHPKFDEVKMYKKGSWAPPLVTVTDEKNQPLYILLMGYIAADKKRPEIYSLSIIPVEK